MKLTSLIVGSLLVWSAVQSAQAAVTYRIYATREGLVGGTTANGHVIQSRDHFVALPSSTVLNAKGQYTYTVSIRNPANGRVASNVPVWDIGPWNTHDNYWHEPRAMWQSLDRGTPEAEAAYTSGFNGGKDEFGRTVANPAGIDIADGTFWDDLGMSDNGWVDVTYNWETPSAPDLKDNVHVFGRGGDGACWIRSWYSGDGWHDWYSLGGSITGGPDAYSRNSGHVAVVVHSASNPGHIKQNVWSGSWGGWSDLWTSVGGNMTSDPACCARGTDNVHIFARGPNNDCMKRSWNANTGWAEWASEGGSLAGAPDCCSKSASHLIVCVRSATEPGHIKSKTWTASGGWGGWVDLYTSTGGLMDSDPSCVNRGDTKVHVFARKGNDVWIRTHTESTGWADWYSLGSPSGSAIVSSPDSYSRGSSHVAVVVRNQYNNCWKKTWTTDGGWGVWESLGQPSGGLTSSPGAVAR